MKQPRPVQTGRSHGIGLDSRDGGRVNAPYQFDMQVRQRRTTPCQTLQ